MTGASTGLYLAPNGLHTLKMEAEEISQSNYFCITIIAASATSLWDLEFLGNLMVSVEVEHVRIGKKEWAVCAERARQHSVAAVCQLEEVELGWTRRRVLLELI